MKTSIHVFYTNCSFLYRRFCYISTMECGRLSSDVWEIVKKKWPFWNSRWDWSQVKIIIQLKIIPITKKDYTNFSAITIEGWIRLEKYFSSGKLLKAAKIGECMGLFDIFPKTIHSLLFLKACKSISIWPNISKHGKSNNFSMIHKKCRW